ARARYHAAPASPAARAGDHAARRSADALPRRPDGGGGSRVLRPDLWARRRSRAGPYRRVLHHGIHAVVLLLRLPEPHPYAPGTRILLDPLSVRGHRRIRAAPGRGVDLPAGPRGLRRPSLLRRLLALHPSAGPHARHVRRGGEAVLCSVRRETGDAPRPGGLK